MTGDKRASILPHPPPQLHIFKEFNHALGIRRRILHGYAIPVKAIFDQIVTTANIRYDSRQPTAEGFDQRCRQSLMPRWKDIDIRHSIEILWCFLFPHDNN